MVNKVGKSQILKAKSDIFKGGAKEKRAFASEAGGKGFSSLQMEKKLKEMGYDVKRRKNVINQLKGGIGNKDLATLTKEEVGKLSWPDQQRVKRAIKKKQAQNIKIGRMSQAQQEQKDYIAQGGGVREGDKSSIGGLVGGSARKGSFAGGKSSEDSGFSSSPGSSPSGAPGSGVVGGPPTPTSRPSLPF